MAGVRQDMRGTKKSQGNFTIWHDSASDDFDTMQWWIDRFFLFLLTKPSTVSLLRRLSKQPWANTKVPSVYMGFSADGISAYTAVKVIFGGAVALSHHLISLSSCLQDRPEWLKAYFIGWSTPSGYPIIFPGGAYRKSLTDFWMKVTIPDQSARFVPLHPCETPFPKLSRRASQQVHPRDTVA